MITTMKIIKMCCALMAFALAVTGCGGVEYLEGEKTAQYELGVIGKLPATADLRVMGEDVVNRILSFNYLVDVPGKINILNEETSRYNVDEGSDIGAPEVIESRDEGAGRELIHYPSDVNGVYDLVTQEWVSWFLPDYPPYNPPSPTEDDVNTYRTFTARLAEDIAIEFSSRMGFRINGYLIKTKLSKSKLSATVTFIEELSDTEIDSPNWVNVEINYWGMVTEFTRNNGPKTLIATQPTLGIKEAKETLKVMWNLPKDMNIPDPQRVIKRERFQKEDKVIIEDNLCWFFDLSGITGVRKRIVMISAHSGELLD